MKVLKVLLSFLIIIFSVIVGLYFGTIRVKDNASNPGLKNNQDRLNFIFPSPEVINLTNGDVISGKEEIIIAAPGAVALRLSARTLEGDEVSEAEIPKNGSITKFIWDTEDYIDGQYYFNLMVYYKDGAPSKITKFLAIDNAGTLKPRQSLVDEKLVIEKIKIDEENSGVISGFALGDIEDEDFYLNNVLSQTRSQIFPNQSGYWEAPINITDGRYIFSLESGVKSSYQAEFYFSNDESVVNDQPNKEEIKKEVTRYGVLGGGISGLLVSFAWFLGMVFSGKERRVSEE